MVCPPPQSESRPRALVLLGIHKQNVEHFVTHLLDIGDLRNVDAVFVRSKMTQVRMLSAS